jgi:hypothetical protein
MQRKHSQSLIDFINFLPLQSVAERAPVSNHESTILYKIWKGQEEHSKTAVADVGDLNELKNNGFIKSKFGYLMDTNPQNIELTAKGKEVIKNIVLYGEQSSFRKKSGREIDYDAIYHKSRQQQKQSDKKVAHIVSQDRNWLTEIVSGT